MNFNTELLKLALAKELLGNREKVIDFVKADIDAKLPLAARAAAIDWVNRGLPLVLTAMDSAPNKKKWDVIIMNKLYAGKIKIRINVL
jgi:hypothetical protein